MDPGAPLVRETHSAVVVMVGDRVYKAKKPVRLPFLDFSSLAARRSIAEREVVLNRRIAPDVYLGVGDWRAPDIPPGQEPEPVVVMRRMPEDRRLATLVTRHREPADETLANAIRSIARTVAAFHARAQRSAQIDTAGDPAAVATKFTTDVEEARATADGILDAAVLDEVERLGTTYLAGRQPLLRHRVRTGCIRDGHGDLLADDIFVLDDGPRILDCIEFDDRLRWGDVLADVAFLAMDLERLGAPGLAHQLMVGYEEFAGERHPPSLAHFYIAARALIRAKVTAIRVAQGDRGAAEPASRLLALAADHLRRGRVRCVLVGGTPGTGKSTLARRLAPELDAVTVSSDEVRKELAGLSHDAPAPAAFGTGLYSPEHTEATYRELAARARALLGMGVSVVLDASWSRAAHRDLAVTAAAETTSDLHALRCVASAGTVERRLTDRARAGPQPSDATPAIARAMAERADPWPGAIAIDTDGSLDASLDAARRAVGRGG